MTRGNIIACATCAHFDRAAERLEAALPGLMALGSAYAAVRADDGLCSRHERYLTSASRCGHHEAVGPGA